MMICTLVIVGHLLKHELCKLQLNHKNIAVTLRLQTWDLRVISLTGVIAFWKPYKATSAKNAAL